MDAANAILDRLVAAGVDTLFGIPGNQTLPVNEAIAARDDVSFTMVRHETAVSHAAWGYAQAGGGMAGTLVIPGPGDVNAMNGLKSAHDDGVPMIHLSIETDPGDRGKGAIHEAPPATYDTVVKENITVTSRASLLAELDRGLQAAASSPKGPVRVGIPRSFLLGDVPPGQAGSDPSSPPPPESTAVDDAVGLLDAADAPVVIAGAGVRHEDASDALLDVATALDAPVVTTRRGKGVIPEDHPLAAGPMCHANQAAVTACLEAADVALAVGADLDLLTTQGGAYPVPALVHVAVDGRHLGRVYDPVVAIRAGIRDTLAAIRPGLVEARDHDGADRARRVRAGARDRYDEVRGLADVTSPDAFLALRDALPRDAVVAMGGAGAYRMWGQTSFEAYDARSYFTTGSWTTMGTGLPSAIGAAAAVPDAPVVTVMGDGGFLMCVEELHTVAATGIEPLIVVMNNQGYTIIEGGARSGYDFPAPEFSWGGAPIDHVGLADAMGVPGRLGDSPDAIRDAVQAWLEGDDAMLLEVPIPADEPVPIHD